MGPWSSAWQVRWTEGNPRCLETQPAAESPGSKQSGVWRGSELAEPRCSLPGHSRSRSLMPVPFSCSSLERERGLASMPQFPAQDTEEVGSTRAAGSQQTLNGLDLLANFLQGLPVQHPLAVHDQQGEGHSDTDRGPLKLPEAARFRHH